MEKTKAQNIRLGILVVVSTILLVLAAYFIGNRQNLFGNTFTINAVFKNVNGLQKGNNVRYSGIAIGTVNNIEMINDTTIIVNMVIQEKMMAHIRKNATASIGSDGLVGSMIVNIVPGLGEAPLVENGDRIGSYSKIATKDMMSTLNVTNENAALLTADLLEITGALKKGEGTLGLLLKDTVMSKNLMQTSANLKKMSEEAHQSLRRINDLISEIEFEGSVADVLIGDSISGKKMEDILTNLETTSQKMVSISASLDSLSLNISKGKGAINYLATDTLLVRQLERTMKSIEEGTARFNENMEALKHNFLTRRYFKKQEKAEKKNSEN